MRRAPIILLLLLALNAAVLTGVGAARTDTATLRIVAMNPLTVTGSGFHARERARVTATSPSATQTVRVTATRRGTFRVTFGELAPGRCDLVRVVVVRRSGINVVLKRLPLRACLPERSSG